MKQLTLITTSRDGIVAEVSETLADNNVNIETIDAKSFGNEAIVLLTVDKYDIALQALGRLPGFQVISEDAILLRLKDEPGALAKVARRFTDAGVSLRSVRFIQRNEGYGLVAISADRTDEAMELVKDVAVSW